MRFVRETGLSRQYFVGASIAVVVVAADLLTKRQAAISFRDNPVEVIPWLLTFTYTENSGAAFSLFRGAGSLIGVVAFVAVGICAWALRTPRPLLEVVGLGMVAGAAVGNLWDRIARGDGLLDGWVIDWIQFPNFPVFNIADSAITIGVGLLLLASWRSR